MANGLRAQGTGERSCRRVYTAQSECVPLHTAVRKHTHTHTLLPLKLPTYIVFSAYSPRPLPPALPYLRPQAAAKCPSTSAGLGMLPLGVYMASRFSFLFVLDNPP
jgi:hypothetical protein